MTPETRRALFPDPLPDAQLGNKRNFEGDHDEEFTEDESQPDPGQQLLTGNEEYFPDSKKNLGQQLEVVPMTLIPAEVILFQHGNIITANSYYLCYAIKGIPPPVLIPCLKIHRNNDPSDWPQGTDPWPY